VAVLLDPFLEFLDDVAVLVEEERLVLVVEVDPVVPEVVQHVCEVELVQAGVVEQRSVVVYLGAHARGHTRRGRPACRRDAADE
jgi:hypothetical protein